MSTDYRLPEGFENPVPEPGRARRRIPTPPAPSKAWMKKWVGGLIALVIALTFHFGAEGKKLYDELKTDSAATASPGQPSSGKIDLSDGALQATYTGAAGEQVSTADRDTDEFTSERWTLVNDSAAIAVTDYRFEESPVKSSGQLDAYYAATGNEFASTVGTASKPKPISSGGRDGMIWRGSAANGDKYVYAEFPGDPQTVRVACRSDRATASVGLQCEEIISSLEFAD